MKEPSRSLKIRITPATAAQWSKLEALFGPRGACAGCWCMWWRRSAKDWRAGRGEGNRQALRQLVTRGMVPPGLVALDGARAVGWCAVAPRADYPRLDRSRVLAPVDDVPVWSVTCFFVARDWRGQGLTVRLLEAAARFARKHGATLLEGYPVDTGKGTNASAFLFTGIATAFAKAGFQEVARRSPSRPIFRLGLGKAAVRKAHPRKGPG